MVGSELRLGGACCVSGGPSSGKTAFLIERAHALVEAGARPEDVLFVCASPAAAASAAQALPSGVAAVDVRGVALRVLDAARECGLSAGARILEPYEEQILFEDLRTTGLPHKQIRRILEYLYAGMAALSDADGEWLAMREERAVHDALVSTLRFTGGMVEAQVASAAVRLLEGSAQLRSRVCAKHVLADDYGLYSRSSQALCSALALEGISVAGEPGFAPAVADRYPYPAGLGELVSMHPGAQEIFLEGGRTPDSPLAFEETMSADTLHDEFDLVAGLVRAALADASDSGRGIAVVSANGVWLRNMARYLEAQGIPVQMRPRGIRVGDLRDAGACRAARDDALSRLAACSGDGVALRSLAAFGDYCGRSADIRRLREAAPGASLVQLVAGDASDPLLDRLRRELRDALASGALDGRRVRSESGCEVPPDGAPAVFLGFPEEAFGRRFGTVVFGGCVQGWIPSCSYFDAVGARRREAADKARVAVECARRAVAHRLAFTSFSRCDLEFAERYGLHFRRSRLVGGVRMCELVPFDPGQPLEN